MDLGQVIWGTHCYLGFLCHIHNFVYYASAGVSYVAEEKCYGEKTFWKNITNLLANFANLCKNLRWQKNLLQLNNANLKSETTSKSFSIVWNVLQKFW